MTNLPSVMAATRAATSWALRKIESGSGGQLVAICHSMAARPASSATALSICAADHGRIQQGVSGGPGCARVAWAGGSQDAPHRARVAVGERLASFNGKSGDELLDRELFYPLLEVRVLTERYRRTYNRVRPHSSPGATGRRRLRPSCLPTLSSFLSDKHNGCTNIGGRSYGPLQKAWLLAGRTDRAAAITLCASIFRPNR